MPDVVVRRLEPGAVGLDEILRVPPMDDERVALDHEPADGIGRIVQREEVRRAAEPLETGVPLHEVERARVPEGAVRDGVRHSGRSAAEEEPILVDARLDVVERHRSRDRELRLAQPYQNQRLRYAG